MSLEVSAINANATEQFRWRMGSWIDSCYFADYSWQGGHRLNNELAVETSRDDCAQI